MAQVIPIASAAGAREIRGGANGSIRVPSSYGAANTTWGLDPEFTGDGFDARGLYQGERAQELDFRSSYFRCRQHDRRPYDMDGRMVGPQERGGYAGMTPMLGSAPSETQVPLSARRPNAPYRLPRLIVRSFTAMLYGFNRWPQIRSSDPNTQAFGEAVVKACNMRNRMIRARDIAGSNGSAGLSWFFRDGKPKMRVHSARFVHVLEWDDVDALEPRHVTELYQTKASRKNEKGDRESFFVWQRRDWTPEADVVFRPIEVTESNPDRWEVDEERSHEHGDGFPHFVWLTNFPDDEDPSATDGQPDYDGAYEQLVAIDEMNSILAKGVIRNLDPTLKLKMNPAAFAFKNPFVQKGSDNAIVVGEGGDADYMTIEAAFVEAGKMAVEMNRGQVLEVAQCVVLDPKDLAAAGLSSIAIRTYYAPMINAADILREPNGEAIRRLLTQMQTSARRLMGTEGTPPEVIDVDVDVQPVEQANDGDDDDDGDSQVFDNDELDPANREPEVSDVEYYLDLPDRVVLEPVLDAHGKLTGAERQKLIPIVPGAGEFDLEWGEYFPPTVQDKQMSAQAASTAAGGKPVLSQRSAVEMTATTFNKDAQVEWDRVRDEQERAQYVDADIGGKVDDPDELPDGATPKTKTIEEVTLDASGMPKGSKIKTSTEDPGAEAPAEPEEAVGETAKSDEKALLTGTDTAVIVTVNEARASIGLPPLKSPDGQLDPDGLLTVAEFGAKREAVGQGEGENLTRPPEPEPDDDEGPPAPPTFGGM